MRKYLILAAAIALVAPAAAQTPRLFVEGLAGAVVPTFDIADVARTGGAYGAALGVRLSPRLVLMGEFDYGMHKDKATESVDINTVHYMGKLGYSLTGARERGWEAIINLGAGAVTFDIEGADRYTYFAINAGAKLSYNFNRTLAFVLSPQGDIAFSKDTELTTDNAWVWPVTAGFRINFGNRGMVQ
jgi:hypothetical protein